ncbi:amidophosphoribosyltransferase [Burkholderia sp. WAC0059]|uniref:ComF family protein n=1 Tax=Burkholderia sp. WAC0059 TaxID=2066022 RepID=UPI000C7F0CE1|nr:ComF family protein [Burkholderia sp. WAC0059]PLZ03437.1 amidophosphoribosyltransferase [Burkholderia sp. WAC0059]
MPSPTLPPACRPHASVATRAIASANQRLRVWLPRLAQLALPNHCTLCGNLSPTVLCMACDEAYWNEPRLRCAVCALPLSGYRRAAAPYRCGDCIGTPPPFDTTLTLADYRAPLDLLARGLKFRARFGLAREFASRLAHMAEDALDPAHWPDVIVPVPLSAKRLVERGYNQAWQIAKLLAKALHVRADATLVRRVAHTAPQSGFDLATRRHNVAHAFALTGSVHGLHVAVVDDVMTSGATLEALARTLKTAGARRVTNFVALRTPRT